MRTVELNETIIGLFARHEDATAVGQTLIEKGWPVIYLEPEAGEPRWTFDDLATYRRFQKDFEDAIDEHTTPGVFTVTWGCDCDSRKWERCPHGDDPTKLPEPAEEKPLGELYGAALRARINELHPGLCQWLQTALDCLYAALAFGHECEAHSPLNGSAGLKWLREKWPAKRGPNAPLETYDRALDDLAQFVEFASHDAWLSERLAGAGLSPSDLSWCPECDELAPLNCQCEGGEEGK